MTLRTGGSRDCSTPDGQDTAGLVAYRTRVCAAAPPAQIDTGGGGTRPRRPLINVERPPPHSDPRGSAVPDRSQAFPGPVPAARSPGTLLSGYRSSLVASATVATEFCHDDIADHRPIRQD